MADSSSPQRQDGKELGQDATAASSPNHLLQTESEAPDLLGTSNDTLSEQRPAVLPALVASATPPSSALLQPDYPVLADIPSIQSCVVTAADSEKAPGLNEKPDYQEGTLDKAGDPSELPSHAVSDSSRKTKCITEFTQKNPSVVAEALSDKPSARVTAPTETPLTVSEVSVERPAILVPTSSEESAVVGTTSNQMSSMVVTATEKPIVTVTTSSDTSSVIADSNDLTTAASASAERSATVVSTLGEKSPVVTTVTSDKLSSLVASLPEKTPAFVKGQLQVSPIVDVTSPQKCQTLETVQVEESDQTKPSSHASEGELPLINPGRKPTSLPVASPDQSLALPTILTHPSLSSSSSSSSSLPSVSTISSPVSSVTHVDGLQLPCSASSQDSVVEFGSTIMPAQDKGLAQVGSTSSSSQDPHECLRAGNKNQEHMKDKVDGCESDIQRDTSLNIELEREEFSCANSLLDNSSEAANSEQQIQMEGSGECWNDVDPSHEAAMETLPLIVDTHTISQEDVDEEHSVANPDSVVNNDFMSPSVLSSSQLNTSNVNAVPLLESEPLQPVTIGSSLQPLEEVQEASMLDDPSFAADLALIDSSADEADSIGGLVINSVIGAADGVVDFHPEEEMETDRELTDISASAPQVVEESCDNVESSDETGPSAKRMRFENGISDMDDRLQGSKKVIIKILPVKNGHGLWDSHKLQQVLLAKGTILLRLHASTDILEMFDKDKNEKDIDFTGVMAETKDGDHDHILGFPSLDPDGDVYDPLAISAAQSTDHASPPHYGRPYPHSRGRSTALQPAMSRPGFRHLQSPPHPHYYPKHEVFGLPPPLEFEEPQLGTTDWSGVAANSMTSCEQQNFFNSTTIESQKTQLAQERLKEALHMVKVIKVCEDCGKTFDKAPAYLQHLNSHRMLQQCEKCDFKTKDKERFKLHLVSHAKDHFKVRCNICHELFVSPITHRIHKRKIHSLYECKHCLTDFTSETTWAEHLNKAHKKKVKNGSIVQERNENSNHLIIQDHLHASSDKMQIICHLCNKEVRNKYQLKIHLAQHLGVSSNKISDDDLFATDVKPFKLEEGLPSLSYKSYEEGGQIVESNRHTESVFQNLLVHDNFSVSDPQVDNTLVHAPFSDFQTRNVDSILGTSASSNLVLTTDPLPSTSFLEGVTCKEEPLEVDINKKDTFMSQDNLPVNEKQKRKSPRRLRPMIPCNACSSVFTTNTALRNHKKQKHMKRPQCPACNITKSNSRKLLQHQIKAHKDKLRCHYFCLALFDTREEQSAHHLTVHNKDDSKLLCRYCKMEYPRGTYMKHLEECKEDPIIRKGSLCNFCETQFSSACDYKSHVMQCGPGKAKNKENKVDIDSVSNMLKVEAVDVKTNSSPEIINQSDKQPSGKVSRKGEKITKLQKTKGDKKTPEKLVDQERIMKLQDKHLDTGSHLEGSMAESKEILHKCKYCSSTFDSSEDGVSHVLAHHKTLLSYMTKEPQVCHICSKSFRSSLSFCKHILKHYGDLGLWDALVPSDLDMENVRMNCWICKTTGVKYHRYHVTTRDKTIEKLLSSKPSKASSKEGEIFHCSVCDESFPYRYAFWNHIKVHLSKSSFKKAEGGKHFKCSKCPMTFKKKSELLGHLGVHLLQPDLKEGENKCKTGDGCKDSKKDNGNKKNAQAKDGDTPDKHIDQKAFSVDKVSDSKEDPQKCKRCQKRFEKMEDAVSHVSTTHNRLLKQMMAETHVCHICDKTFMKPMVLCNHILKHYNDLNMWDNLVPSNLLEQTQDRRYCWICKNMLGRKASKHVNKRNSYIEKALSSKTKEMEGEETFRCSLCDYACSNRYAYWKHIMLHMYKFPNKRKRMDEPIEYPKNSKHFKEEQLECSECFTKFYEKSDLNKHLATHFLLPFVQVDGKWKNDSSHNVNTQESVNNSNNKNNPESNNGTETVEKTRRGRGEAQAKNLEKKPVSTKMEPKPTDDLRKCIRCSQTFENIDQAVSHVLSSHRFMLTRIIREPLTCHVCGTVFKSQWCLCKHISKHYSELDMWDALVPRDLLNKINLRNQCWICNFKLDKKYANHTSKRNFNIEKLLLSSCEKAEDVFHCSVCNDVYPNRLEYWKHIKIHLHKPPFEHRSLSELLSTACKRTDSKEKLFECSDCSLSFVDEAGLYRHLATHFLECASEQDDFSSPEEHTDNEISEINSSDDEEWLPPLKEFKKSKGRVKKRNTDLKVENECSHKEDEIDEVSEDLNNKLEDEETDDELGEEEEEEEEDADDELEDTCDES